ncbi:MAG: hypothetical protein AAFV19_14425 [Pseudomonadota bacterium]
MRGPLIVIMLAGLGGGLYYMSLQAEESKTRRAALQSAAPVTQQVVATAQPVTTAMPEVKTADASGSAGGLTGTMAQAAMQGFGAAQVPTDPDDIAAATKAMQADVAQKVKARIGFDIRSLDPIKQMAAAEAAKAEAEAEVQTKAPDATPAPEPAAKIVTAEDVLKRSRSESGADEAATALKNVLNKAMDDPRLDGEIEKLLGQLKDPERGRKIVAKARAKGAPEFAILLGLKRQIDKEAEEAEEAAAPAEPKLPQTTSRFKSADKGNRFKSVKN